MSGIFALYDKTGGIDLGEVENRVTRFHLPGSAPHKIECVRHGRSLIGRYHLDIFKQPPLVRLEPGGPLVITTGYCVGGVPAPSADDRTNSGFNAAVLQWFVRALAADDSRALAGVDGAFQLLHDHESRAELTVVVDRCGLQPLYYYNNRHAVAFAPDFALLFALLGRTPEVDRESLTELFEIGFVTGDRTLFSNVRVFPPGSLARLTDGALSFRRFWRPEFAEHDDQFDADRIAPVIDSTLGAAVQQRLGLAGRAAVSLSGGMDSRLLLAAAVKARVPVCACTFGPEDSRDHVIAALVAQKLGVSHHRFVDTPHGSAGIFETGVRKTGGMINVLDFTGMMHLREIARATDIVANGYGGNELFGFLAFGLLRVRRVRCREILAAWLAGKLNPGWSAHELEGIRRSLGDHIPPCIERLEAVLAGYPAQHPLLLVYHFFLEEKARRANLLGVMSDTLHLEPVVPFYSPAVVDLALTIPPRERLLARFYRRLLREQHQEVAAITYNRTGLPADASTFRIALRKLRRSVRRRRDPDSPWDKWLRGELREYVQDHLLTGRPRIADFVRPDWVRRVMTDFLAGGDRRARPVGQLLTIELFLREFYGN